VIDDARWWAFAACRGRSDPSFFAERGEVYSAEVRAVCATCPVRSDCYDHAVAGGEHFGMWGGVVFGRCRAASEPAA
jgi:hypothetical protein